MSGMMRAPGGRATALTPALAHARLVSRRPESRRLRVRGSRKKIRALSFFESIRGHLYHGGENQTRSNSKGSGLRGNLWPATILTIDHFISLISQSQGWGIIVIESHGRWDIDENGNPMGALCIETYAKSDDGEARRNERFDELSDDYWGYIYKGESDDGYSIAVTHDLISTFFESNHTIVLNKSCQSAWCVRTVGPRCV